jgi:hypothetical protein
MSTRDKIKDIWAEIDELNRERQAILQRQFVITEELHENDELREQLTQELMELQRTVN